MTSDQLAIFVHNLLNDIINPQSSTNFVNEMIESKTITHILKSYQIKRIGNNIHLTSKTKDVNDLEINIKQVKL